MTGPISLAALRAEFDRLQARLAEPMDADARAEAWDLDSDRVGVYVGIGLGGATTGEALYKRLHESLQAGRNPTVMHPLSVPRLMPNAATAAISARPAPPSVPSATPPPTHNAPFRSGSAWRAPRSLSNAARKPAGSRGGIRWRAPAFLTAPGPLRKRSARRARSSAGRATDF